MNVFFKRATITLAWIFGIFLALNIFGIGSSIFDYSRICTKCLRESHVAEFRFFGLTYFKTSSLRFSGHDMSPLGESPCKHVFRKGGFGDARGGFFWASVGCGVTEEGGLFLRRWEALSSAFKLNDKLREEGLLKETFQVVDGLLPSDATLDFYQKEDVSSALTKLRRLTTRLMHAKNRSEWADTLAEAKTKIESDGAADSSISRE